MYADAENTRTDATNDIIALVFRFDLNSDRPAINIIAPTSNNIKGDKTLVIVPVIKAQIAILTSTNVKTVLIALKVFLPFFFYSKNGMNSSNY